MLRPVLKEFQDKKDNMRGYKSNDWYPRFGFEPSDERLAVLISGGFIKEQEEQKEYPLATGGGWYELSSGERVQGKKEADKQEKSLREGD